MFQIFILTWNHVQMKQNYVNMVANGGGSGLKFFKIFVFHFRRDA